MTANRAEVSCTVRRIYICLVTKTLTVGRNTNGKSSAIIDCHVSFQPNRRIFPALSFDRQTKGRGGVRGRSLSSGHDEPLESNPSAPTKHFLRLYVFALQAELT